MPRPPLRGTVASVNDPDKGEVQCSQFSLSDYPFLDIFWTMCIFFAWVIWIWLLILVLSDNFRRRDHSGFCEGDVDALRHLPAVTGSAGVHDRPAAGRRRADGSNGHLTPDVRRRLEDT